LQTRKWQDNSGQDRYTTEIVANEMQMLDSRGDSNAMGGGSYQRGSYQPRQQAPQQAPQQGGYQQQAPQGGGQSAPQQPAPANDFDDDIPF